MQEIRRRKVAGIGLRIAVPKFVRVLALALLACGVAAVAISYWRLRNHTEFRMRAGQAQLSTEVVGDIRNLEHREMKGDRLWVVLTADRDLTFSAGHHELEHVPLEPSPDKGDQPDKISSQKTLTNEDNTQFIFSGNVQVETRDHLIARADSMDYDVKTEVGSVSTPVNFERENVSGRADSATLDGKSKKLGLKGNVEVTVKPETDEQQKSQPAGVPNLKLHGLPVTVKSAQADFDQNAMTLSFGGGAVAEQGQDVMSGDTLTSNLSEQKRVRHIAALGSAYLRSLNEGHSAEVFADQLQFDFDDNQKLQSAHAIRNVRAGTIGADSDAQIVTQGAVDLDFAVQDERSVLKQMTAGARPPADAIRLYWHTTGKDLERAEADGNVELLVEPAQASPAADRKTLSATLLRCWFYDAGTLAQTVSASGGARAVVEPLQETPKRGTRTLTSQGMQGQFFRETQDVEHFEAAGDAHFQERERNLVSQKMTATFSRDTSALERVDATGDPKYTEQDRNGQSASMSYTTGDGVVRMRGGEPVVWDSRARLKATEIDADTVNKISNARGKVQTTYYSQEQTGGAAPFKNVKSPVFIASNAAEFQHDTGVGIYTGNARAWQDDNFVKAERIVLLRDQKRMEAEGSVQSALYNARRKEANGTRTVVPVFATSRTMFYSDSDRLVHYEGDVDIRQGTERITGGLADVYLQKNDTYEVEHTAAQHNAVVTQPGRRGTGDWAQYTAEDEKVVLTGNPARVEDADKGTSESRRMIVYLRDNRVISDGGEGAQQQSTGRVHTTHKIKKQ